MLPDSYEPPWFAYAMAMYFCSLAVLLGYKKGWVWAVRTVVFQLAGIGLVWLLYGVYEWKMLEWGKTVRNPIRIDLIFIMPLLEKLTGWGYQYWKLGR